MRILLIDDKDEFRNDLHLWLTDTLKHGVTVARSIEEAKEQLQKDRYHAILLDGRLRNIMADRIDPSPTRTGGASGLEVLREMSPKQVSMTIWMTAHHGDDPSDPALLGCNRFLFKRWITLDNSKDSDTFYLKLQGHLDCIAAKRWDVLTMILCGIAILLVGTGVIWQIVKDFTPALLAALVGTIVNLVTFLSMLTGRPVHRLFRRRRL